MNHASEKDLKIIEDLITGSDGTVTLRMELAAALVDEIRKHRQRISTSERSSEQHTIEIGTLLSSRTKEGRVELVVEGHAAQLDIPKAREIATMLLSAIEAATSDQLVYAFLTKLGLADAQASRALLDFRELRQGSRGTVFLQ